MRPLLSPSLPPSPHPLLSPSSPSIISSLFLLTLINIYVYDLRSGSTPLHILKGHEPLSVNSVQFQHPRSAASLPASSISASTPLPAPPTHSNYSTPSSAHHNSSSAAHHSTSASVYPPVSKSDIIMTDTSNTFPSASDQITNCLNQASMTRQRYLFKVLIILLMLLYPPL